MSVTPSGTPLLATAAIRRMTGRYDARSLVEGTRGRDIILRFSKIPRRDSRRRGSA